MLTRLREVVGAENGWMVGIKEVEYPTGYFQSLNKMLNCYQETNLLQ